MPRCRGQQTSIRRVSTPVECGYGFDPSSVASSVDPSSIDSALGAASSVDPSSAAADSAASTSAAGLYQEWFDDPNHAFDQQWIDGTTILGNLTVQYDTFVNRSGVTSAAEEHVHRQRRQRYRRRNMAQPTGGDGGLWFGDGGNGGTDLPVRAVPAASRTTVTAASAVTGFEAAGGAGGDSGYGIAGNGGDGGDAPYPRH